MNINCYQVNEALKIIPLTADKIMSACSNPAATTWLDLQETDPEELEVWLDKLGIKGSSRRLCLQSRNRSGFYPLKEALFLVIPVLVQTESSAGIDYVAFLCRENLLLTLHQKAVFKPQQLAELEESDAWLPACSIAALVSAMMIDASQECLQHASDLRSSILSLEERMDRQPDDVEADEILNLRAKLITLASVVSDQLPPLQSLSKTDKPFFKLTDAQEYMSSALVNLQAVDRSLEWMDARITALRSGFQMHAQDKTNRRLNILTILSAIFMPITLLAGIWGMNFETMPELKYSFSYPLALGLMVIIGSGMFYYFRKNNWLD